MADGKDRTTGIRYQWADIEADNPAPGATRRLVKGERAMFARFEFEAGFEVPPHVHHNEQISMVEEGELIFTVGSIDSDEFREEALGPGQLIVLPPFVPHGARATRHTVAYDLFSPPSDKTGIDQR